MSETSEIIGNSLAIRDLRQSLREIYGPILEIDKPEPVLLLGERGTGKDLVARHLHGTSARRRGPFVAVNCAELSDELAAARLFGHKRGAFTHALGDEQGLFRSAQGGVLFLDEVGELSSRGQALLLRALEDHAVLPVGETRAVPFDVAIVFATNRDLEEDARAGTLRADLYDRIRTFSIRLPPLRERPEDIGELLVHFRHRYEDKYRARTRGFSENVLSLLHTYSWPGNVRELSRLCALLVGHARAEGGRLDCELLERLYPQAFLTGKRAAEAPADPNGSYSAVLAAFRSNLILSRLAYFDGNRGKACASLGLSRATFHRYLREVHAASQ